MAKNADRIRLEEIANSVVHPVTKEMIMKQTQLLNAPLLQDNWTKGMCKELGRLTHGYGEKGTGDYVKGTNIVQVAICARIVVDY